MKLFAWCIPRACWGTSRVGEKLRSRLVGELLAVDREGPITSTRIRKLSVLLWNSTHYIMRIRRLLS